MSNTPNQVTFAVSPATVPEMVPEPTEWSKVIQANPATMTESQRILPTVGAVKSRRVKKTTPASHSDSPQKTKKSVGTKTAKSAKAAKAAKAPADEHAKPRVPKVPREPCKSCATEENKSCMLCTQKGRDEVSNTHCVQCCNYCSHCDRKGHQLYNADGSVQCFKMRECDICKETGHTEEYCRRDFCETCRTDGKGHNFIGHTTDRCRKNHKCTQCKRTGHYEERCKVCKTCGKFGHLEDQCKSCESCGQSGHITTQCDKDKVCEICGKTGHNMSRCRGCKLCGYPMPGKDATWTHKCKRDARTKECRECGDVAIGKCDCYQYVRR